ncbi:hypothetical protein [Streptosporangium roseum]|uniref:hypothetical protein n=1 Tax=Streptosporangium roseum TaxID=2001 RepID=UPI00333169F9
MSHLVMFGDMAAAPERSTIYDILLGGIVFLTALVGLFAAGRGSKASRLANDKTALEIAKLRRELDASGDGSQAATASLRQALGTRATVVGVQRVITQFIILYLALQFWFVVEIFVSQVPLVSIFAASDYVFPMVIAVGTIQVAAQLVIVVWFGIPLLRDIGNLYGMSLRELISRNRRVEVADDKHSQA